MSYQEFRPTKFQILPPVVKNLMIVNGILFLATIVLDDKFGFDLTRYLGLYFFSSDYFFPHQIITHLFMHGSFMHLLSNMFVLWMFGNILENYWGAKKFFIYYMVTGIGAAMIHLLFTWYEVDAMQSVVDAFALAPSPQGLEMLASKYQGFVGFQQAIEVNKFAEAWRLEPSNAAYIKEAIAFSDQLMSTKMNIPTVGASGAVFGVLLAFGMMFPNHVIYLYFAIPIKAKWFVMLYGLFELYSGVQNNPGDNVAHFAHLGGMLFGYLLIRSWRKNQFHS